LNQSKILKITLPVVTIILLLVSVAWMAGFFNEKIQPHSTLVNHKAKTNQYSNGDILEVVAEEVATFEKIPAGLKAREATIISTRILGRIDSINVRAGDSVERGQLLITLDNNALKAKVSQAESEEQSVAALAKEALKNLGRIEELKRKDLVSVSDLDKATASYNKLKSDLETTRQALSEAKTSLNYSKIKAPISGRIVERQAEPGNMATPGQSLLSLYNPSSLQVHAAVRESLATKLKLGQSVEVEIESTNSKIVATISEIVPAADPNSRSFIVKADLPYEHALLPGLFARVKVSTGTESQITIPNGYIQRYGQLDMVWVINKNQRTRRFIRLGEMGTEKTEVISGLTIGENISR